MPSNFISDNTSQTKKIGKDLAEKISKSKKKREKAVILALKGELGGGKTTFLQGFARGLGIRQRILSPTFVILKKFEIPNKRLNFFYHIDCYRIKNKREILNLGFKKISSDPKNIIAIEWAERIESLLPRGSILINFSFNNKTKRKIVIQCQSKKRN